MTELINQLKELGWTKYHVSITSKECRDNNFYVSKEETRVDGPFTNENEVYIPSDVLKMTTLRPWQQSLLDTLTPYSERSVDIVYDPIGNNGKSQISRYLMSYHDAESLPFCNDYKDIMRMAYDVGPKKIYIIDLPRAISKEKLFQFLVVLKHSKVVIALMIDINSPEDYLKNHVFVYSQIHTQTFLLCPTICGTYGLSIIAS